MTVQAATVIIRFEQLSLKSTTQLEAAVTAALKGALNVKDFYVETQTVLYDAQAEELLDDAIRGLTPHYPALIDPNFVQKVRRAVSPDTHNIQIEYEFAKVREAVENAILNLQAGDTNED